MRAIFLIPIISLLQSCIVYYIEKNDFLEQAKGTKLVYSDGIRTDGLPFSTLQSVKCYDKKGKLYQIDKSPVIKIYLKGSKAIQAPSDKFFLINDSLFLLPVEKNGTKMLINTDSIIIIKVYEEIFFNILD